MNSNNSDAVIAEKAVLVKAALAAYLAENGQTLHDLENALAKKAGFLDQVKGVKDFGLGLGEIGLGTAMLAGGGAGLGLYAGYKGLKDSEKKLQEAEAVKQRIRLAQRELETELAGRGHNQYA